jgi:predicted nucleotidyltransferase
MITSEKLTNCIVKWAERVSCVNAIFAYGSYAKSQHLPSSDLDLCLLLRPGKTSQKLNSLYKSLPYKIYWKKNYEGKSVAYIGDELLKLDIIIATSVDQLAWLATNPDCNPPRLKLLFGDKNNYSLLLKKANKVIKLNNKNRFIDESTKFLNYFELCSRSHKRSDSFQFYFNYNLALTCLVRMFHILETKERAQYLYSPKFSLSVFGGNRIDEGRKWTKLSGSLYLPDAHECKLRLIDMYFLIMKTGSVYLGNRSKKINHNIKTFLEKIVKRDLFFNVRDFANAYEGLIKYNLLFRAPTLARWKEKPELKTFLKEKKIKKIIDLRKDSELTKDDGKLKYSKTVLKNIKYIRVPIGGGENFKEGGEYMRCLMSNLAGFVKSIKEVAHSKVNTVVHCHVGKDRTGIVCALIALLLEQDDNKIVLDYVLSEQGVKDQKMKSLIDDIRKAGGVTKILTNAGLTQKDIILLRKRYLNQ